MGLTPVELERKEFSRSRKGYNIEEVDQYFKTVLEEYETLYCENQELQATCTGLRQDLGKYKSLESTITETLVTAQKAGEDARNNAVKEGELILREAKIQGEEMITKVKEEIQEQEKELQKVIKRHQIAVAEMRLFLTSHLEMLDQEGLSLSEDQEAEDQELIGEGFEFEAIEEEAAVAIEA